MSNRHLGRGRLLRCLFLPVAVLGSCSFVIQFVSNYYEYMLNSNIENRSCVKLDETMNRNIHLLEVKANDLLRQTERTGLSHPPSGRNIIHYKASRFQLSLGHSLSFNFSVHSTENPGLNLSETSYYNLTDGINCPIYIPNGIPHFAQIAFPCWSVLQRFPLARRFVEVGARKGNAWVTDFLRAYESDGINVLDNVAKSTANNSFSRPQWKVVIPPVASGWQEKSDSDFQFEQGNPFYFLNQLDMQSFQSHVLGDQYQNTSGFSIPFRVLIVQRKGFSRDWIHAEETAKQIEKIWGVNGLIKVKHIPNPEGSLQTQAVEFHQADIIISPHGAQLTNLAFIRPCTSVLELFPVQYYLAFFQPYVLSAGGTSFDGYPFGREPLYDSKDTGNIGAGVRGQLRGKQILASAESILRAFPRLVVSMISCKRAAAANDFP